MQQHLGLHLVKMLLENNVSNRNLFFFSLFEDEKQKHSKTNKFIFCLFCFSKKFLMVAAITIIFGLIMLVTFRNLQTLSSIPALLTFLFLCFIFKILTFFSHLWE